MKALWKGYIMLGRLGIPVRLYAATRDAGPKFVQLHHLDGSPVERPLFCKKEHQEISLRDTVRGVEIEPGKYVTFTGRELQRSQEGPAKAIVVRQFCEPAQIVPAYFDRPYYVVPAAGGERGYALLREGLSRTATWAIGRFYFYGNEYVGAIAPTEDVLTLYRLRFAEELVPRTSVRTPSLPRSDPAQINMMQSVIERYSGQLHLRDYHNEYAEHVLLLAERKAKGLPLPRPERPGAEATPEADITSLLAEITNSDESTNLLASGDDSHKSA